MCTGKNRSDAQSERRDRDSKLCSWTDAAGLAKEFDRLAMSAEVSCLQRDKARHRQTRTEKIRSGSDDAWPFSSNECQKSIRMERILESATNPPAARKQALQAEP